MVIFFSFFSARQPWINCYLALNEIKIPGMYLIFVFVFSCGIIDQRLDNDAKSEIITRLIRLGKLRRSR